MGVRMGILLLLAVSLAPLALTSSQFLALELGGAAVGIALALWGASQTRFEKRGEELVYIPHTSAHQGWSEAR